MYKVKELLKKLFGKNVLKNEMLFEKNQSFFMYDMVNSIYIASTTIQLQQSI
jgi:hypothetical protein